MFHHLHVIPFLPTQIPPYFSSPDASVLCFGGGETDPYWIMREEVLLCREATLKSSVVRQRGEWLILALERAGMIW